MPAPDPERQVQFLANMQRLLSDGSFVATYKFALLLSLADLAVERGDDTTESLALDTLDLAAFRGLIGAWARFVRRLPQNERLIGEGPDLREFLFGSDRSALAAIRDLLREVDGNGCFYCGRAIRGEPAVDHFVPWARYPLDLGHNFVLADARCNGFKLDRLSAFDHLEHWCERNAGGAWTAALDERLLPHDAARTRRVAAWAYSQTERAEATVWQEGRDGLIDLDPRWHALLGADLPRR